MSWLYRYDSGKVMCKNLKKQTLHETWNLTQKVEFGINLMTANMVFWEPQQDTKDHMSLQN